MDAVENAIRSNSAMFSSVIVGMIMSGQWDKLYNAAFIAAAIYVGMYVINKWRARLPTCCAMFNSSDHITVMATIVKFVQINNCYIGDYTDAEKRDNNLPGYLSPANGTAYYTYVDTPSEFMNDNNAEFEIVRVFTNATIRICIVFNHLKENTLRGSTSVVCANVFAPRTVIENFLRFAKLYVDDVENKKGKKYLNIHLWNARNTQWEQRPITITKTRENMFISKENEAKIYPMLDNFAATKKLYDLVGNPWKKGILLYGPPGTGKSSFAHLIASMMNYPIYKFSADALNKNPDIAFYKVVRNSVVVINDIDVALGTTVVYTFKLPSDFPSDYNNVPKSFTTGLFITLHHNKLDWSETDIYSELDMFEEQWRITRTCDLRELEKLVQNAINVYNIQDLRYAEFLAEYITSVSTTENKNLHALYDIFDGVGILTGCVIVITSNKLAAIDKTMIRPGRIDLVAKFDLANQEVVDRIFKFMLQCDGPQIGDDRISQASVISTILIDPSYDNAHARVLELIKKPSIDLPRLRGTAKTPRPTHKIDNVPL